MSKQFKVSNVEKLDEEKAYAMLQNLRGAGYGAYAEIKSEIFRRVGSGEKFFALSILTNDGANPDSKQAVKMVAALNLDFHRNSYSHRVRYSPEKGALIVVPLKLYRTLFKTLKKD